MKGITISEMKLGDSASFTKTVSEHDVYTYAGVKQRKKPHVSFSLMKLMLLVVVVELDLAEETMNAKTH